MMRRLLKPLDRYVLREFIKIFVSTAVGFPLLLIVFDLTDHIDTYLSRNLPRGDIALSYVYWFPESMYLALPAAVLFATVFSIGALTRHTEITAAKASGISFHRLTRPVYVAALGVTALSLVLGQLAPIGNRRRSQLLDETRFSYATERYGFAFAAEAGRVYKVAELHATTRRMGGLQVERKGREGDASYPTWIAVANTARWSESRGWLLLDGQLHILQPDRPNLTIKFDSLRDRHVLESPTQLLASPKTPEDMPYGELGRYAAALERSGSDVNTLRVDRALQIAIPVTCFIIALFGAPLATSTQRGGAAWGIGLSLAVTVAFLAFIQMTKAIGGKGLVEPELAAWLPNILFGAGGVLLLTRVRT
jgi:lipopolysaccharide export system permease protein